MVLLLCIFFVIIQLSLRADTTLSTSLYYQALSLEQRVFIKSLLLCVVEHQLTMWNVKHKTYPRACHRVYVTLPKVVYFQVVEYYPINDALFQSSF